MSGKLVLECTAPKYTGEVSEIQSGLVTGHGPGEFYVLPIQHKLEVIIVNTGKAN